MLLPVLSNFSGKDTKKEGLAEICPVQRQGETSGNGAQNMSNVDACSGGKEFNEV